MPTDRIGIRTERDPQSSQPRSLRRRDLLALIGAASGSAVMYRAMAALSLAPESRYAGPIGLDGARRERRS
jgi:monoamine oxidase